MATHAHETGRGLRLGEHAADEFDARLRDRYASLWRDVQRELVKQRGEPYADIAGDVPDPGDAALADLLVDLDLAEIDRDVAELRAVHRALDRLHRGVYGLCRDCGGQIAAQRLRALPDAERCLACQERLERRTRGQPSL